MNKVSIFSVCFTALILCGCEFLSKSPEATFRVSSDHKDEEELLYISYSEDDDVVHKGNSWSDTIDVQIGDYLYITASATYGPVSVSISVDGTDVIDNRCDDSSDSGVAQCWLWVERKDEEDDIAKLATSIRVFASNLIRFFDR